MCEERRLAKLEFESGNYVLAAKFASYALAKNPDCFVSWDLLGHASLKTGWLGEGVDAFEQAALRKPLSTESRIELAIAYGALGRDELSSDLLMILAVSGECSLSSSLRIAFGLDLVGQPKLAVEVCRIAGRLAPDSAEIQHQMAAYLLKSGQPANLAETLLCSAVSLEPANINYRISLASLLSRLGRQREAIECVRDACSDQLGSVCCLCCLKRLANLFFDGGELELAKQCAAQAASLQDA
ncbi:hypothetical protein OAM37_03250 [bacterium]|nr:hypothetical protein [Planctomycetaceae bacterium]MDC0317523.1 hypothetical protein [bacterium]